MFCPLFYFRIFHLLLSRTLRTNPQKRKVGFLHSIGLRELVRRLDLFQARNRFARFAAEMQVIMAMPGRTCMAGSKFQRSIHIHDLMHHTFLHEPVEHAVDRYAVTQAI